MDDMPERKLSLKGGGHEAVCRTLGSEGGWIGGSHIDGTSTNKNVGPEERWIVRSHIGW